MSCVDNRGKNILDSGNGKCKVPEAGTCLAFQVTVRRTELMQQSEQGEMYR